MYCVKSIVHPYCRVKTSVVLESLISRAFLVNCAVKTELERAITGLFHLLDFVLFKKFHVLFYICIDLTLAALNVLHCWWEIGIACSYSRNSAPVIPEGSSVEGTSLTLSNSETYWAAASHCWSAAGSAELLDMSWWQLGFVIAHIPAHRRSYRTLRRAVLVASCYRQAANTDGMS